MMNRLSGVLVGLVLVPLALHAESDQADAIWRAMRVDEFVAVIREEGLGYGTDLETDLFDGKGGAAWRAELEAIYDGDRMVRGLRLALEDAVGDTDIGLATAFFSTGLGARAISLELSARRALLEPEIEDASHAALDDMIAGADPRLELITRFSDANDLVENNIVGALNGNYAFLKAMTAGGQGPYVGNSSTILGDVWAREPEIRSDTQKWVLSFFGFAYGPLSDRELEGLIEFSESAPGRAVNAAFFAAFDVLFTELSAQLGAAAARFMASERL